MTRRKNDDEYIDCTTTVRIDRATREHLRETVIGLDTSQSAFIRKALKDAIAAAKETI